MAAALRTGVAACGFAMAAALASPPAAAQPAASPVYRIGILNEGWAANHPTVEGLKAGLRHAGLVEGRDVTFEIRFTEGRRGEALQAAAKALVDRRVDLLFTSQEAATAAAKKASSTIPIVFTLVGEPVAHRFVASLARPGGNVTGVHDASTQLTSKRLEILRMLQPGLKRVWFFYRSDNPTDAAALTALGQAARSLRLELLPRAVEGDGQVARSLKESRKGDAVLAPHVDHDNGTLQILQASVAARMPAMFPPGGWVTGGGLVSYGPNFYGQGLQAARMVVKVLQGARPASLPVQVADDFELEINLNTARLLGIDVPRELLFRANVFRQ